MTAIRKALVLVNWDFIFLNKTVHDQALAFDQFLMDIYTNYITNNYNSFNNQDPPWMNDHIKLKIQQKNSFFRQCVKNSETVRDYQNNNLQ